jgi:hypothetical protein
MIVFEPDAQISYIDEGHYQCLQKFILRIVIFKSGKATVQNEANWLTIKGKCQTEIPVEIVFMVLPVIYWFLFAPFFLEWR